METGLEAMEQEHSDYSRRQKISWLCPHLSRIKPKELFWRNILHFSPLVPDCQLRRTCMRWPWLTQNKTDWIQTTRKNPFCPNNFSGVASPICKACVNISGCTLHFTGHNWVLSNWQSSAGLSFHVWVHCILLIIVFCFWRKGSRSGSESVWFPFLLISAIHIPGPLVKFQYYLKCSLSLFPLLKNLSFWFLWGHLESRENVCLDLLNPVSVLLRAMSISQGFCVLLCYPKEQHRSQWPSQ